MVELTVGSRFWCRDKLYEVCEGNCLDDYKCDISIRKCGKCKCKSKERHDKKDVYFKRIDEKIVD